MEVYKASADFSPPASEGKHNLLSFRKDDQFEVFDRSKADWWGARRLNDNTVGYVPSKYLQYEERRIGKLLPDNYHEHRENQLKRFAAMQNSEQHKHPVSIYGEFGVPMDYDVSVEDGVPLDYGLPTDYLPPPAGSPYMVPDIPTPDYDPDTSKAERNSFVFVEKFRHVITNIRSIEELYSEVPEPDPDYQDEDSSDFPPPPPPIASEDMSQTPSSETSTGATTIIGVRNGAVSSPEDEGELIQPKKLVNPCVLSRERQALHKELLLNYKLGKDVLQKPELNKILAKRKETQKRKEWEEQKASKRTSLELRLEEQANKLKEKEESEKMKTIEEDDKAPEFVQMHRRITHKSPTSPPT